MDNIDLRREDVKRFHETFGVMRRRAFIDATNADALARELLLKEEFKEFEEAKTDVERFDAVIDIEYIIAGTQDVLHLERVFTARVSSLTQGVAWILAELAKPKLCHAGLMQSMSATRAWLDDHARRLQEGFDRVHRTNMNKAWNFEQVSNNADPDKMSITKVGPTQYVVKRKPDGKILKPPSWTAPILDDLVTGDIFV